MYKQAAKSPERFQVAGRAELDGHPVAGPEDPGELPEGRRQRPLRVGARHGQERLPGSQEGETLARRQAERAGEVLGDQKLHDEGKTQEEQGEKESEEAAKLKPLGNLDQLT